MCTLCYILRQTLLIQIKIIEEQFWNKVMYFVSFSAKYFDVIDKFDCKHLHQKLVMRCCIHFMFPQYYY